MARRSAADAADRPRAASPRLPPADRRPRRGRGGKNARRGLRRRRLFPALAARGERPLPCARWPLPELVVVAILGPPPSRARRQPSRGLHASPPDRLEIPPRGPRAGGLG